MQLPPTKKTDPIQFLLERKFPNYRILNTQLSQIEWTTRNRELRPKLEQEQKQFKEYESQLQAMSAGDLQNLFEREKSKLVKEMSAKLKEEEQARYFNQPYSDADFNYWGKMPYWTIDEAIALSFGKNPELVNWSKLIEERFIPQSPFIEKFLRTLKLAQRAIIAKQISEPVWPGAFIAWAKRNGLDFPQKLVDEVESRGQVIADWKDLYDQLKEKYEVLEKAYTQVTEKQNGQSADTNQTDKVLSSEYLQGFLGKVKRTVDEYPPWKKTQKRKIQKTGNLHNWLMRDIGADTREAELLKKILSDNFEDLR
jgi:hypothetical protein